MSRFPLLEAVVCVWVVAICATFYSQADHQGGKWYKGNTHTHTLWSDGNDFPEMIGLWYRDHGYDFLVYTDHNVLAEGERWMNIRDVNRRGGHEALDKYIARLGADWVQVRGEDPQREVRLKTLEETRKVVQTEKFLLIQGEEVSDGFEKAPIHTNAINVQEVLKPQGGKDLRDVMRRNLVAVAEQAEKYKQPILPHLNHPNFHYAVTAEDIAHVLEEEFFEVYNGHPGVAHQGNDVHASIERMWDIANTIRVAELQAPPLYGVGTDDSHNYHSENAAHALTGRGWVMVRAGRLTPADLLHAMRHGDFYASSGVELEDVQYKDGRLTVKVKSDGQSKFTIQFVGTTKGYDATSKERLNAKGKPVTREYSQEVGRVLQESQGQEATYVLKGDELYVRAVVSSDQPPPRPIFAGQVQQAWTQPVGWEKWVDEKKVKLHFKHHQHPH